MKTKEIIEILENAGCGDPFECPAGMYGKNKDDNWGCFAKYPNGNPDEENQGCIFHQAAKALKEQEDEIRQLRLALNIMKGNGIKVYDDGSTEP